MPKTSIIVGVAKERWGGATIPGAGSQQKIRFQQNQLSDSEISDMSTGEAVEHGDLGPKTTDSLQSYWI